MRRLFTFGCSFTSYHWPTWADIAGKEFDYFENWGLSGASNQYMFNSLIEANLRNNFTSDDTIAIMWTNVSRLDVYKNNRWQLPGNIYTSDFYSKEFLEKFTDYRGFFIRDLSVIAATNDLLKSWNVKYYNLSMVPIDNIDQSTIADYNCSDVKELYSDTIANIRHSIFETVFNYNWQVERNEPPLSYPWHDFHARPLEHLQYLDAVLPEIKISDETRDWVANYPYWNTKTFLNYPKIRL
jgi:hypothetical protein